LIKIESKVTVNDVHPQRLIRDLIMNSVELIHPDVLGGESNEHLPLQNNNDDESILDNAASTRGIWDAKAESKLGRRNSLSSIASSIKSHWTKKTGYSVTIAPVDEQSFRPMSALSDRFTELTSHE
jgi:hypothetical protein